MSNDHRRVNEEQLYRRLERYREIVPGSWARFREIVETPPPVTVWRNAGRIGHEAFRSWMEEYEEVDAHAVPWDDRLYRLTSRRSGEGLKPGNLLAYGAGLYHIQEEAAALPVRALRLQPGQRVLDLCAAPGNKSAQMAQQVGAGGMVVANDVSERRLQSAVPTWERLGVTNVVGTVYDGRTFPRVGPVFDAVLVDAPCSGEGTCRRNPGALRSPAADFEDRLSGTQAALLERAAELCRPGGRIVYCTCTFAPEENELQVDRFLRSAAGAAVEAEGISVPGIRLTPGITAWQGRALHPGVAEAVRLWPHENDTGGFFVAAFRKRREDAGPGSRRIEAQDGAGDGGALPGSAPVTPPGHLRPVDADEHLAALEARFGIDRKELRTRFRYFQGGNRNLVIADRSLAPPPELQIRFLGMRFLRTAMATPKLTAEAVPLLSPLVTRNRIDLNAEEMTAVRRQIELQVPVARLEVYTGPGFVIAMYRGLAVALTSAGPAGDPGNAGDTATLKSWYPQGRLGRA